MVHPSAAIAYSSMSEMSMVPNQDATAEQILTQMCARCHNGNLDQSLSRAKFDATNLAGLDDLQKAVIADRIQRHEGDRFQMPPRRSGTMPQWAVSRVLDYLGSNPSAPSLPEQPRHVRARCARHPEARVRYLSLPLISHFISLSRDTGSLAVVDGAAKQSSTLA